MTSAVILRFTNKTELTVPDFIVVDWCIQEYAPSKILPKQLSGYDSGPTSVVLQWKSKEKNENFKTITSKLEELGNEC